MANYRAVATGNWSNGATWAGGAVPPNGAGHNIYSNGFIVTIDTNANVNLVTNASITASFVGGGTSAAMGGYFELSNGITLTSNVIRGNSASNAFTLFISGTNSANIVGNISSQSGLAGAAAANTFQINTSGTVNITGNVSGGDGMVQTPGIFTGSSATINITGNVTAGSGGNSINGFSRGIQSSGLASINVTGNVTGGTLTNGQIGIQHGNGNLSVVGSVTAGNSSGSHGISTGSGTVSVTGNITATNAANGVVATGNSNTTFSGSFISSVTGMAAIHCAQYRVSPAPIAAITRYASNGSGTYIDMFTADNTGLAPAVGDVRAGVVYGSATGALAVPPANSVAFGVPVDNTTGTAVLTAAAIRAELATELARIDAAVSSRLAPNGTLATVTTLTNAPASVTPAQIRQEMDTNSTKLANLDATVSSRLATSGYTAPTTPPTAAANATAVRTELATELARVDVATSTRLAGSAYTAPSNSDVTAIKAKTDLLETTRLAQCSTVATTGAQIAAALS